MKDKEILAVFEDHRTSPMTSKKWNIITAEILSHLNCIEFEDRSEQAKTFQGPFVGIKNRYQNVLIRNVTVLSMNNLYPNIMLQGATMHNFDTNYIEFFEVYGRIIELRKSLNGESFNLRSVMKQYVNYTYGMLSKFTKSDGEEFHNHSNLKVSRNFVDYIPQKSYDIVQTLFDSMVEIVYADTDTVFIQNYAQCGDVFDKLTVNSPYTWEVDWPNVTAFISAKKRFMLFDKEHIVNMQGMRTV